MILESGRTQALEGLIRCMRQTGQEEQAAEYERQLEESVDEV